MARFWLGPWVWRTTQIGAYWGAPDGTLRTIDLRSDAQQAASGPAAVGNGLFITSDAATLGADYVEVPQNLGLLDRNRIRNKLGLSQAVLAPGRAGLVLELLTRHAAVDGSTFCRPLMPNRRGRLRLLFDGGVDEDHQINAASPFWSKIQTVLQAQYRDYRTRALGGLLPNDFHRKWLSVQLEKFSGQITDHHAFIPTDLPDESPLPHSTTLTETFNTGDSSTLGPTYSWTEYRVDTANDAWSVVSNQCKITYESSECHARADSDLASDDHYAQCSVVACGTGSENVQIGVGCRFNASAVTYYGLRVLRVLGQTQIYKCVAGTLTELATRVDTSLSEPDDIKVQADGSTIKGWWNGTEQYSLTDTSITGNTRAGVFGYIDTGKDGRLDSWTASDVGGTAYSLDVAAGSYAISGTAAAGEHDYSLSAGTASYEITGAGTTYDSTYIASVSAGAFTLSGAAVTLSWSGEAVPTGGGGMGASRMHLSMGMRI